MARLTVINGIWACMMFTMLAFTAVLYAQKPKITESLGPWPVALVEK
jgi:hypothetical protein